MPFQKPFQLQTEIKYNPKHAIGTCGLCGKEIVYNVVRLGPDGGFIHKDTGTFACIKISHNCIISG